MIRIYGDSGESSHGRLSELAVVASKDNHFSLEGTAELAVDLRFETEDWAMNVEVKDFTGENNSDFVASILSGHAWDQCRAMRQLEEECCFLVLGTRQDLRNAILKAADMKHRPGEYRKMPQDRLISTYSNLVKDFRRNCDLLRCPTYLKGEAPWFQDTKKSVWENLLHLVFKRYSGGDRYAHMPSWSDDEIEIGTLIDRCRGLGKVRAAEVNRYYKLQLVPRYGEGIELESLEGIGPKTAELIRKELMS